ncbi:MAG TPA: OmpA family protein, partial [Terriglobia bacterium]|nr:OmpA family protein [Terriglobia bacterium]
SIDANSNQISELSGVSREHTQKIAALDSGLKTADEKASQAINIGQGAQTTATQAASQVSRLDMEFQNRNNYTEVNEHSVLFAFGSASIDKNGFATLDAVAQQVKDSPNAILVLEGRTDSTGDSNYNILLGEKRLEAVIRHLVVELSVPLHQIYKMSFGEARPVAANDSREGRARNRAVVIRVMEPKPGAGQAGQGGAIVSDTAPLTR